MGQQQFRPDLNAEKGTVKVLGLAYIFFFWNHIRMQLMPQPQRAQSRVYSA